MSKRGTDHTWELVKYSGDIAVYARCKCKFRYSVGDMREQNSDYLFYPYCPMCGAKKKWYSDKLRKIEER